MPRSASAIRIDVLERLRAQREYQVSNVASVYSDREYTEGELAAAAAAYAVPPRLRDQHVNFDMAADRPPLWPWGRNKWRPSDQRLDELAKAGALILAEMERLVHAAEEAREEDPHPVRAYAELPRRSVTGAVFDPHGLGRQELMERQFATEFSSNLADRDALVPNARAVRSDAVLVRDDAGNITVRYPPIAHARPEVVGNITVRHPPIAQARPEVWNPLRENNRNTDARPAQTFGWVEREIQRAQFNHAATVMAGVGYPNAQGEESLTVTVTPSARLAVFTDPEEVVRRIRAIHRYRNVNPTRANPCGVEFIYDISDANLRGPQ